MEKLLQNVRYGWRMLRKNPGFSVVAVLTLALGIGANTAIFSVVRAVLLRPLAFPDSSRLVLVYEGYPKLGFPKIGFSAPDLKLYQQAQQSFEGMAAYQNKSYELSGAGEPERVTGARVSAGLFPLLGMQPVLGRGFLEEEDQPGHSIAVLSYGLWQSKYGGSPSVIGQTVSLDRVPYTVVGVMPRDFRFPLPGPSGNRDPAALWVPMAFTQDELTGWGNMYNNDVVARLKAGVSVEQASSEASVLAQRILTAYPAALLKMFGDPVLVAQAFPLQGEVVGEVRPLLVVLQAAVVLVLLIACANVGLLLLARASGRSREIGLRTALGATRSQLVGQLLTESMMLALMGGALGLGLAVWSKGALLQQLPPGIALPREVPLDGAVLLFTVATTVLTVFLFGLVPALETTRADLRGCLQEGGRGGTAGRVRHRVQGSLVVVQFALALVLMAGAGLLLRSFTKLLATNPGFRPESVLAMSVPLPQQAYPHATEIRNFYQQAIAEVGRLPGVVSVGAATDLPLNGTELGAVEIEGGAASNPGNMPAIRHSWVLGDYEQTMGIPLVRGRLLTVADRQGTQPVALVSESMARTLWPGGDAVGKRIRRGGPQAAWMTVVGVVGDVHDGALTAPPQPHSYSPFLQASDSFVEDNIAGLLRTLNLALRTHGDPAALGTTVVRQLHRLDPALAVVNVRAMQSEVKSSVAPQRFNATLVGIYAGAALLLAMVGIYGVLAYMVTQQTREIGIRMALGAQQRDILGLVLRHGLRLVVIGALAGLAGAWVATRLMQSLLYGVTPRDPATFLGVTLLLAAAGLLACCVPALRAARVDPMVALRYE